MDSLKRSWKRLPAQVRQAIVLVIGMAFVIAAPFTGVLPGPGGIPVFLVGVAILATEFHWAARLRDYCLRLLHEFGVYYRKHRFHGNLLIGILIMAGVAISYVVYTRIL